MKNKIIIVRIYTNNKDNSPEWKVFEEIIKATKEYEREIYLERKNKKNRRVFKRKK